MDKNQREARRRQEDRALNRGLLWVAGAIVLEALLLLVNRYYINILTSEVDIAIFLQGAMKIVRIAGAAAGTVSLVWAILQFRKGKAFTLFTVIGLACWALSVCSHVVLAFDKAGMQMLFLLVPAWAGLALVYYLYQRELFLAATASGLAAVGLWFVRYGGMGFEAGLTVVGILLVAAVALWLKKSGGVIRRGAGEEVQVMAKNTSYALVLASCLVGLAALIAGVLLGGVISYYLIFGMVAWMFVLLVYYTVKLM